MIIKEYKSKYLNWDIMELNNKLLIYYSYVNCYIVHFPAYLFHESCHYLSVISFWILGICDFPKIKFKHWYKIELHNITTVHFGIVVKIKQYWLPYKVKAIVAFINITAPIIGLLCLLYFSPWYMYIYYLTHLQILWISSVDGNNLKRIYNSLHVHRF